MVLVLVGEWEEWEEQSLKEQSCEVCRLARPIGSDHPSSSPAHVSTYLDLARNDTRAATRRLNTRKTDALDCCSRHESEWQDFVRVNSCLVKGLSQCSHPERPL